MTTQQLAKAVELSNKMGATRKKIEHYTRAWQKTEGNATWVTIGNGDTVETFYFSPNTTPPKIAPEQVESFIRAHLQFLHDELESLTVQFENL